MHEHFVNAPGARLFVGGTGSGADVLLLSGGPGCSHYLARDELAPRGFRTWFPDPRGVGRSTGGPHTMARAVADLEAIREALGIASWVVIGHSWGCELAVRYAVEHPASFRSLVGIAGRGAQRDRHWSATCGGCRHQTVVAAGATGRPSSAGFVHIGARRAT